MKVFCRVVLIAVLMTAVFLVAAYHRTQAAPLSAPYQGQGGPNTNLQPGTLISVKGQRHFKLVTDAELAKGRKVPEKSWIASGKIESFQGILGAYDSGCSLNRFTFCQTSGPISKESDTRSIQYGEVKVEKRSFLFFRWTADTCSGSWVDGWLDIEAGTATPFKR